MRGFPKEGVPVASESSGDRRHRRHRFGRLRCAPGARRRGRRLSAAIPEKARGTNPTATWHAWDPTTNALRPRRSPASTVSSTSSARRSTSAGTRRSSSGSARAGSARPRTSSTACSPRSPARRRSSPARRSATTASRTATASSTRTRAAGDDFLAQVVVDWEAAANEAAKGGVRVATVRTGLVLEPESGLLKQLLPIFKLGGGGPLAGGDQYMPWIHIDDEVALILWALDTEASRARSTWRRRTR